MAERSLPDDVALWPTNPYELLGLGLGADARVARRAYLGLVRRFKPEHSPEQFKRIREAYEFVERVIASQAAYARQNDADQDDDDDWGRDAANENEWDTQGLEVIDDLEVIEEEPPYTAEVAAPPAEGASSAPRGVPLFAADPDAQCEEIWRELCDSGDPADAYARLVSLVEHPGGAVEACLRLYWLTVAAPEMDPRRGPCHWLVEGLRLSRLEGRLRELYRRELDAHPHEAATQRCSELLQLNAPRGATSDLAEWRWRALGRIGRCDLLLADMPHLRQRIVFDDEEAWGRLLLVAIDQLVWSDSPHAQQAAVSCRQELDSMNHLHGALDRDLDRLDLLWEVAAGWRRLRVAVSVPRAWTDAIPVTWSRDFERIRPLLLPLLQEIARDPLRSLGVLDEMARQGAAAVAQLGFTIDAWRYSEERYEHDRRTDEDRTALVGKFIHSRDCTNYRAIRRELLMLCIVEALEPAAFAQAADQLTQHLAGNGSWQDLVTDDGPLRYIYAGYRAFGS